MMNKIDKIGISAMGYKNVIGYSSAIKPKIRNNIVTEDKAIRIYVTKKEPINQLRRDEIIPCTLGDYPVDIVEIGCINALSTPDPRRTHVRPLISGSSVGNYAITAGTLGIPAKYTDGNLYAMSNAHVFHENPSSDTAPYEKRIVQPGAYDGGIATSDMIGEYFWHQRIFGNEEVSDCPVANTIQKILNKGFELGGAKTRFTTYVSGTNHQDLAACKLLDGIEFDTSKTWDFPLNDCELVARIFAGGSGTSVSCKVQYQLDAGFLPVLRYSTDIKEGDVLIKSGRTSGFTQGTITDIDANVIVDYGNFTALHQDVIFTSPMCEGGDSGSDVWRKI